MKTTKKAACLKAWNELVSHYETCSFSTFYKRVYRLYNGNWHYVGRAHDYTF